MQFLESLGRFSHFTLRALLATPWALRRPGQFLSQLYQILMGALPLALAAGLTLGGYTVPGLRTRRAETEVELGDSQSFAIAGTGCPEAFASACHRSAAAALPY